MAERACNGRGAACRFCGRKSGPGEHRAPGPLGPICPSCLEAGLALVRDGRERRSRGGTSLVRVVSAGSDACEFCDRSVRRSFFGRHRPLPRMSCTQGHAVICRDCLDRGGELLNHVLRQRIPR
ncbi:hypothetical protein FPZ12_002030 [Amycolatopsis acidicola]|uniref:ClpX-type ZB domain-containing protein n=1 Tax=Amycolatopsis acidicola TaxID=2596893 RepID=A0A5N0VM25_9PSEU|nr:hypothetical protein [Amycolatopsis acidicola]KAA9166364.1 hypothetical protein FPZ12_002030 [Amycolatopsis acidicola]